MTQEISVAMVGFGEAGQAFAQGWRSEAPVAVRAHDIKSLDPAQQPAMAEAQASLGVAGIELSQLAAVATVLCLVTADQAVAAAEAAAPFLASGAIWLDGNSCSPGSKRRASAVIEAHGGRYVDMAIMAPVRPRLHKTPILLSGAAAEAAAERLRQLGMQPAVAGASVGDASSIKVLRSVMVKGFEALTAECLLAARRAGVEDAVLASLQASDPQFDWRARAAYNLERMQAHGTRRAAEMREVAVALRELGLPDRMASATAGWQSDIGAQGTGGADLVTRLDEILAHLK